MEASAHTAAGAQGLAPRPAHWRWNFAVLGGDIAFFTLGLSISSAQTILPLFVHHLTSSNESVALISAVRNLGVYGPQLLVAPLIERLRRAKPLILGVTVFERLPFLLLALGVIWLVGSERSTLLTVFYVMVFVQQFAGGLIYPAWLDLIARTIPLEWRGRFFGLWTGIGGLAGIGGAAVAAALVATVLWPLNFAVVFGLTFVCFIVSFVLLALGREPARLVTPATRPRTRHGAWSLSTTLARVQGQNQAVMGVWRGDAGLRWLVVANAAAGIATMGGALFAVAALQQGGLSAPAVGAESTVLVVAMTAGNFLWGALGDRIGHRSVLMGSAVCAAAAGAVALGARGFVAYGVVFLLLGLSLAATSLGQFTFITEMAPNSRRPTYIALAAVAYAPFAVGAPIAGGWLADQWGYTPVFAASIVAAAISVVIYWWRVPEPRHGNADGAGNQLR